MGEDEETIAKMRKEAEAAAQMRMEGGTMTSEKGAKKEGKVKGSAAEHTYSYFDKWDKYDVEEALEAVDTNILEHKPHRRATTKPPSVKKGFLKDSNAGLGDTRSDTPATDNDQSAEEATTKEEENKEETEEERQSRLEKEAREKKEKEEADRRYEESKRERAKQHKEREKRERAEREERKSAYAKKKIEDGWGKAKWNQKPAKQRELGDWDNFDIDAECEEIEDEDRRSRGLNDVEIRNEKILEIMQDQDLSEKEKMERCMHMTGHDDYQHKETEEDVARREQQELINKMQDPRYQPREKMHYLHEAYQKYGGPDPAKARQQQKEEGEERLKELQAQMAALNAPG